MNYNDQILENKTFKFVKQLVYNLAVAICIVLAFCLLMVYAFHYRPYNVLTASMHPAIKVGDMVIVHKENEYKVGDVLKFDQTETSELPTVHRLIGIKDNTYICHGDNVGYQYSANSSWEEERDAIKDKSLAEVKSEASALYQYVTIDQIEGKVIGVAKNYGTYINFVADHKVLFITIVLGLWCITSVAQNEIELRRAKRLF